MPRGLLTSGHATTALGGLLARACTGAATGSRWPMLVLPLPRGRLWFVGLARRADRGRAALRLVVRESARSRPRLLRAPLVLLLPASRSAGWCGAARPALYSAAARMGGPLPRWRQTPSWPSASRRCLPRRASARPCITGPDGDRLGSIAAPIGSASQRLAVDLDARAQHQLQCSSTRIGGPGQSGLPFTPALRRAFECDFVVVDWDQRGTGKSHAALEPTSTYTLDRIVADTVQLAHHLAHRFGEEKVYRWHGHGG